MNHEGLTSARTRLVVSLKGAREVHMRQPPLQHSFISSARSGWLLETHKQPLAMLGTGFPACVAEVSRERTWIRVLNAWRTKNAREARNAPGRLNEVHERFPRGARVYRGRSLDGLWRLFAGNPPAGADE